MGAVTAIAVTPGTRWLIQNHVPYLDDGYCSLTRMDTIAVGCCLAYLVYLRSFRQMMNMPVRNAYWVTFTLALLVGLSVWLTMKSPTYEMILHPLVVAGAYATTIWLWTIRADSLFGWLLNSKPAVAIGLLSYSIYLWQQPFLSPFSDKWYAQSPVNLIFITILACGSYLLIERPILKLKERATSSAA
jgi:peptidoglycan/LPS O-acetylase OafA/YrhL